MENSLYDTYCTLQKSYYDIKIHANKYFSGDPLTEQSECRAFIKKHFDDGCKQEALCIPWNDKYQSNGKHTHTVSLYLFGLLFENILEESLKNTFDKLISSVNDWYDFKYTWFLTCLYHDVASCIEDEQLPEYPNDAQKQLSLYLGDLNILYTPYSHIPMKQRVSLTRFAEPLIHNYFRYRATSAALEHGIIGGYYLFDRLYKNFIAHTVDHNWKDCSVYMNNGLKWRLEHLDHFAYISDAIICHNLWTVPQLEKDKSIIYRAFGLSPLIVEPGQEGIQFNQFPLQFLLCLLDSLEPVKRFEKLSAKEVLQQVSVQLSQNHENMYSIDISWDKSLEKQDGFKNWIIITELDKWMQVTVDDTKLDDRVLKIQFSKAL